MHNITDIPIQEYLDYSLKLNDREVDMLQLLMEFLPDTIIDAHAHCNTSAHVETIDDGIYHHMMSTFPAFSLEDSAKVQRVLYPGKKVRTLRFANAYRGINHRRANEYLVTHSPTEDKVALYGIPDDPDYTNEMLTSGKFNGLKMYYQYFNPPAQYIEQVFPREILAVAQELEIPIILHLPKMITASVDDLEHILTDFPKLIVVLAHLGLPHLPVPNLTSVYEYFAQYPNLFMDTAMIPSWEVVYMALKAFGPSRIMFGSDEPLNLIRSTVYNNPNKGQRLITEYPYHWVNLDEHATYAHLAGEVIQTQWQALAAIKIATEQYAPKLHRRISQAIFCTNASLVYGF